MKYYTINVNAPEALAQVKKELEGFLTALENVSHFTERGADIRITLALDCKIPKYEYKLSVKNGGAEVNISASRLIDVFSAAYNYLERVGIAFGIDGGVLCAEGNFNTDVDLHMVPSVKRRAIRQHINFPMDISSCELADAKRYILNLVRMQYNAITFHSYPGQFYGYTQNGKRYYGGNYFYGQQHAIHNTALLKEKVDNENCFCIPSAEQYINDTEKNESFAYFWLSGLIAYCRQLGMEVILSFEPRDMTHNEIVVTARRLMETFKPDELEFATQETGGTPRGMGKDEVMEFISSLFGAETFSDTVNAVLGDVYEKKPPGFKGFIQLPGTYKEYCASVKAIKDMPEFVGKLRVMLYCTCWWTLEIATDIHSRFFSSIPFGLLCSHGAERVAEMIEKLNIPQSILKSFVCYSWAEFDGAMFLSQNSMPHNERLVKILKAKNNGGQIFHIGHNHWRNKENAENVEYGGRVMLDSRYSYVRYIKELADRRGCPAANLKKIFTNISAADSMIRNQLGNIGFCFVYCWYKKNHAEDLGYIGYWTREDINKCRSYYQNALEILSKTRFKADWIKEKIFWEAKIKSSVIHLDCMESLTRLAPLVKSGGCPRERAVEICNDALVFAKRYMKLTAGHLADRGCKGLLISYYHTVFHYIYVLRERFGGIPVPESFEKKILDAPPSPINMERPSGGFH